MTRVDKCWTNIE